MGLSSDHQLPPDVPVVAECAELSECEFTFPPVSTEPRYVHGATVKVPGGALPLDEVGEILSRLESFRDQILPERQVSAEERAAITFALSEPKEITRRPALFERFSQTYIIPGRTDLGSFKCFGGLTAPANAWFDIMMKLYDRAGIHTEIYPLKGQNGNWKDFSSTTFNDMVIDILDKTQPEDVVFAHSTSVAAMLDAWDRKPGFCRAMVAIGAPLYLKNKKHEERMDQVLQSYGYRFAGMLRLLRYAHVPYPRRDNPYSRRVPQFSKLPISTSLEFRKAQLAGLRAIQERIFPPIFYAQGKEDNVVSESVREIFAGPVLRSTYKYIAQSYEGADHSPQYGPKQKYLLRDIAVFLRRMYLREGFRPQILPEFSKRTGALNRFPAGYDFFTPPIG